MKYAVFCGIRTEFVPHKRHITSLLQSTTGECYVRSEVSMEATMKNAVFGDIEPQFLPHKKHVTSLLQSPAGHCKI
jgi:hypothetical protein